MEMEMVDNLKKKMNVQMIFNGISNEVENESATDSANQNKLRN